MKVILTFIFIAVAAAVGATVIRMIFDPAAFLLLFP
jgi:hypothetical protein